MKIELLFLNRSVGSDFAQTLSLGFFRTKKSAYHYVKEHRKSFGEGYFILSIDKKNGHYFEDVLAQDILNL